ncbi:MAG: hypothetical protein IIZ33_03340 [Erysipelotrichaceae bacterium]|nr:hypothetical protein [Erysipelotrichaceae bacterium]
MNLFWICIITGVILFIGLAAFYSIGGAFGSQNMRDRMDDAGMDMSGKRRRDLGIDPDEKK